jgi:hypothetical protein
MSFGFQHTETEATHSATVTQLSTTRTEREMRNWLNNCQLYMTREELLAVIDAYQSYERQITEIDQAVAAGEKTLADAYQENSDAHSHLVADLRIIFEIKQYRRTHATCR